MRHLTISDHHFNHHSIIELCNRPFFSCKKVPCESTCIADMNSAMIKMWNDNVEQEDVVFYLGDFGFGDKNLLSQVLHKLHGTKILIRGNHDPKMKVCLEIGWEQVHQELAFTTDSDHQVLLRHKPWTEDWLPSGIEAVVHGHIHNRLDTRGHININVSVEVLDYKPIDLNYLVDRHLRVMGYEQRLSCV